ncbi:MAG: hypothetical protein ACLGQW_01945 [Acidobacteriota bacterium]
MRTLTLCALLAVLAGAAGCLATQPLTISEFRGNCYQTSTGRFSDCDSIVVCEVYASMLETEVANAETCMAECTKTHASLFRQYAYRGCGPVVDAGNDWCVRYCRTNYPPAQK